MRKEGNSLVPQWPLLFTKARLPEELQVIENPGHLLMENRHLSAGPVGSRLHLLQDFSIQHLELGVHIYRISSPPEYLLI